MTVVGGGAFLPLKKSDSQLTEGHSLYSVTSLTYKHDLTFMLLKTWSY